MKIFGHLKSDFSYPISLLGIVALYNLTFFRSYVPLTEGWFSSYAWWLNEGHPIYSGFHFFLTPLYPVLLAIFTRIFGYEFIYLRILGIAIICIFSLGIFKVFSLYFSKRISLFAAIATTFYYQSGGAHLTYDFIQVMSAFRIWCLYFLIRSLGETSHHVKSYFSPSSGFMIAGILSALAFLTKQSNGTVLFGSDLVLICLGFLLYRRENPLKPLMWYLGGFSLIVGICLIVIAWKSSIPYFIRDAFQAAAQAKGTSLKLILFRGLRTLLFNSMTPIFLGWWLVYCGSCGYIVMEGMKSRFPSLYNKLHPALSIPLPSPTLIVLSFIAVIFFPNIIPMPVLINHHGLMIICFFVSALAAIPIQSNSKNQITLFLIALGSLAFMAGTGTSAGVSEAGAFLGFGLTICLLMYLSSWFYIGQAVTIIFVFIASLQFVELKLKRPYSWWNIEVPDLRKGHYIQSQEPLLKGLRVDSETEKIISQITRIIRTHTQQNDIIVGFPNIPIFNILTGRPFLDRAIVHWFDFLPDSLALEEAQSILTLKPKVFIYYDTGDAVWTRHESLFRGGQPSGQRKILSNALLLFKQENYQKEIIPYGEQANFHVWYRTEF